LKDKTKTLTVNPFSKEEAELVKLARRLSGSDRPTFYHDCIMRAVRQTVLVGEQNGGV